MDALSFFNQVKQACQEMPHISRLLNEYEVLNGGQTVAGESAEDRAQLQRRYESARAVRRQGLLIIDSLPDIRWAVCLRRTYIDGWAVRQIAASLGVSPRSVWNYRRDGLAWVDDKGLLGEGCAKGLKSQAQ